MVKFRGIEICIVSQFDIRRLPEVRYVEAEGLVDPFHDDHLISRHNPSIASCYVPIYPGSQIWFEYTIDGPHPPKSAYFFKLLINGKVITSWDCTEKHDYHGKMLYNLVCEERDEFSGQVLVRRHGFRFEDQSENQESSDAQGDLIEIRIHRIERRRRIKILETEAGHGSLRERRNHSLTFTDSGLLDSGFPRKRFSYQLLDPTDEPYAIFRFYCRSYEYLEDRGLIPIPSAHSSFSITSSSEGQDETLRSEYDESNSVAGMCRESPNFTEPSPEPSKTKTKQRSSPSEIKRLGDTTPTRSSVSGRTFNRHQVQSDSTETLSMLAKDSVEDIPSSVRRSPKGPRPQLYESRRVERHSIIPDIPPSPTKHPQRHPKSFQKGLSIDVDEIGSCLEIEKRLLSPFTNGGVLRAVEGTRSMSTSSHSLVSSSARDGFEQDPVNDQSERKENSDPRMTIKSKEKRGRRSLRGLLGRKSSSEEFTN